MCSYTQNPRYICILVIWAKTLYLVDIHVAGVLGIGGDAVVLLDQGVEHVGEVLVGVPVSGVDAAVLVVELQQNHHQHHHQQHHQHQQQHQQPQHHRQ